MKQNLPSKQGVMKPGRVEEITSTANPRIKAIKALAMKKNRDSENLFVCEGLKLATDALDAGWSIKTLLYSKNAAGDDGLRGRIEALSTKARARGSDILITSDKVLTALTRRDNPQAVVAVVEQKLASPDEIQCDPGTTWIALDRVRDPGNLGTIIRTCDALGAQGVILVGQTTDPFALETVRATMGSLFHTHLFKMDEESFIELAQSWRKTGGQLVGTHLNGAVDHRSIDYSQAPQILLMGNEQQGLTDDLAATCTHLALISMNGRADSLNLSVATGIMLFEAQRHKLATIGAGA